MLIIAVEGESDKGAVEALLNRLEKHADILLMRGNRPIKIANKIVAKATKYMSRGVRIEKIIVLKDLHEYREEIIKRHLETIRQRVQHLARYYGIIVRYAIEAWILADVSCLQKTLGITTRQINPESIERPNEYLDALFMKKNKRYVKSKALLYRLVKNIDINTAIKNSKSFHEFISALKDP
mgnify:CR=1 FL=1